MINPVIKFLNESAILNERNALSKILSDPEEAKKSGIEFTTTKDGDVTKMVSKNGQITKTVIGDEPDAHKPLSRLTQVTLRGHDDAKEIGSGATYTEGDNDGDPFAVKTPSKKRIQNIANGLKKGEPVSKSEMNLIARKNIADTVDNTAVKRALNALNPDQEKPTKVQEYLKDHPNAIKK